MIAAQVTDTYTGEFLAWLCHNTSAMKLTGEPAKPNNLEDARRVTRNAP